MLIIYYWDNLFGLVCFFAFEALKVLCSDSEYDKRQIELYMETTLMAVHHGGKVGSAARTLAKKKSSKPAKSRAGKTLAMKCYDIYM